MFDIYKKYAADEIRNQIGWKNDIGTHDLSIAIMVLCDIITELQTKIAKLEEAQQAAQ